MADNDDIAQRPPDPFIVARITDPQAGPPPTLTLVGLLGDSDRPGRRRLYLSTRLDYWVEVRAEDVLAVDDVGPDQPPFQGLDATRLTVVRDAQLDYVRMATAGADDPFAVQPLTAQGQPRIPLADTWEAECPGPSWGDCPTEIGCPTANDCASGWTVCKPRTCRETQGATCRTCETCGRTCGCATLDGDACPTLPTGCAATCGLTCVGTCLNTCAATCLNTCAATCQATVCGATCGSTCFNTCFNTCGPTCFNTCGPTCGATCAATVCAATCSPTCLTVCQFTRDPTRCETVGLCPTVLQTHCNTCRC